MSAVCATLQVARSNIAEQVAGRPSRQSSAACRPMATDGCMLFWCAKLASGANHLPFTSGSTGS